MEERKYDARHEYFKMVTGMQTVEARSGNRVYILSTKGEDLALAYLHVLERKLIRMHLER